MEYQTFFVKNKRIVQPQPADARFYPEKLVHFAYSVQPHEKQVKTLSGFSEYLGYYASDVDMDLLEKTLHPAERHKLLKLEYHMLHFAKRHDIENGGFGISIVNHMRKADGTDIMVWRRVFPFITGDPTQDAVYSYCMDITPHYFSDKITFQVIKSGRADFDVKEAQQYFSELLYGSMIKFTQRQLDVIRTWSSTDSIKDAADLLNMEVRTLETHLKNARKRLGVRRTLDLVIYAKERGWL